MKLLTKHKGVELEIDIYSGIIQEISSTAAQLIASGRYRGYSRYSSTAVQQYSSTAEQQYSSTAVQQYSS